MGGDALLRIWKGSVLLRGARRGVRGLEAAARSSAAGGSLARLRRHMLALAPAVRVRLAGMLVLTAVVTDELLLRVVPSHLRPEPPGAPALVIATAAILVIALAPQLVRAWPSSALRHRLERRAR